MPQIIAIGLICLGKRYLEIIQLSENMIEKAIVEGQRKLLNDVLMSIEDTIIVYSVSESKLGQSSLP
jgi:hypothetical protein